MVNNWPRHAEFDEVTEALKWPTQEEVRRATRRAFWFDAVVNVFAVAGAVAVMYVFYVAVTFT